ncbi:MAG: iron ABC transporter permease, partial [Moorella sp. (in: firmicutes)]
MQPLLATFLSSVTTPEGGLTLAHYREFFHWGANLEALFTSLLISVLSVLTTSAVGVGLAFLLHRFEFPGRKLLETLALVPMALPPLIGVLTFMFLFSESGIIPRGLQVLF